MANKGYYDQNIRIAYELDSRKNNPKYAHFIEAYAQLQDLVNTHLHILGEAVHKAVEEEQEYINSLVHRIVYDYTLSVDEQGWMRIVITPNFEGSKEELQLIEGRIKTISTMSFRIAAHTLFLKHRIEGTVIHCEWLEENEGKVIPEDVEIKFMHQIVPEEIIIQSMKRK